ncbi:MAG: hypothetical protein MK041_09040, partial [Aquabacterium sp.]|nr:hypothetical protein [Aquabacterium sp.]
MTTIALQTSLVPARGRGRRGLAAAVMLAGALLAGCSGMRTINAEVSSFGTWPAGRAPGPAAAPRTPGRRCGRPGTATASRMPACAAGPAAACAAASR